MSAASVIVHGMDNHLFAIADTLGLTLYYDGRDRSATAFEERPVTLGPWSGNTKVHAVTDYVSDKGAAALVKVRKSLWAYIVSYRFNDMPHLVMLLFDGKAAGVKTGRMRDFLTGDVGATMAKIIPHVGAMFQYSNQQWVPTDVASLDGQTLQ